MDEIKKYERIIKVINENKTYAVNETKVETIKGLLSEFMWQCEYSPLGDFLAILDWGGKIFLLNVADLQACNIQFSFFNSTFFDLKFSYNGEFLATCTDSKRVLIFDIKTCDLFREFRTTKDMVSVGFSLCSNYIFGAGEDGCIMKWDIRENKLVSDFQFLEDFIQKLILSPDGKYFLVVNITCTVFLIDADDYSILKRFEHDGDIFDAAFHPKSHEIAISDRTDNVKIWSCENGELLHSFCVNSGLQKLQYIGNSILSGLTNDGFLLFFRRGDFHLNQKVYIGCDEDFSSFAISNDETSLICGKCNDNEIKCFQLDFDLSKHAEIIELSKPDGFVISTLISMNFSNQTIRQLISSGIHINQQEYNLVIDMSWDLVDFNENNGGNMHEFVTDQNNDHN
eukprot:TRINITY_DN3121_c4_g3_i1.p1 TRINITY_DN3121_c4_g3~~TRINITY_DN3121_c4_g3_i1.p1  ORF type:complete len:398 (-),score=115.18 TRINITY_DN3121_c4_g3_i1:549-1742(-)